MGKRKASAISEEEEEDLKPFDEAALPFKKKGQEKAASLGINTFKKKNWKSIKQLLQVDRDEFGAKLPAEFATYESVGAAPSVFPPKKYCDITGLQANYTCPRTGVRYCTKEIYQMIRAMPEGCEQKYLAVRKAAVVLR